MSCRTPLRLPHSPLRSAWCSSSQSAAASLTSRFSATTTRRRALALGMEVPTQERRHVLGGAGVEACPSADARPRQAQRRIPGGSPGAGAEVPARSSRACAARGVGASVVVSALTSTTGHNDDSTRLVIFFFSFFK